MRRELLILVALMLLFCISPVSAYDNEESQSITFCETLPDDVLFYPDNESHGSGFVESFADVSDWTYHSSSGLTAGQYSISSDGDVATISITADDTGNEWVIYEIVPSSLSVNNYIEFSYRVVATDAIAYVYVEGTTGKVWPLYGGVSTSFTTVKEWIPSLGAITGDITSIGFYCNDNPDSVATGTPQTQWDYLRVGPADEMGWQHDGSTTAGVEDEGEANWDFTKSSDGDILTLTIKRTTASAGWGSFWIKYDTTTTEADIERDYYPFLETYYRVTSINTSYVRIAPHMDGYREGSPLLSESTTTSWKTGRINLKAMATVSANKYIEVWTYASGNNQLVTIELDYIKAYSIANYTVTQSGAGVDDYLYVSGGTLYSHVDSGSITLDHDPSIDINTHYGWNMDTSQGTPEIDFYNGAWIGYTTVTEDAFVYITVTTVTDFRLKFTDNANIISLLFLDLTMIEINIFNELFLSTELWGYFGPLGLVVLGYLLTKKDRSLGIFMFIVDCLVIAHYLTLVEVTPDYWWHIIILLFGVISCTIQMIDR